MSHFAVLVIGEDVEKQLAPYHEFECTGHDDEYVQEIDVTEQARKEYEKDTTRRYKDPKGGVHKPWEDRFYRDLLPEEEKKIAGSGFGDGISWHSKDWGDGKGYRAKVAFMPSGWEEVSLPVKEVMGFLDWAKDNYSYEAIKSYSEYDQADKHKYGYIWINENNEVDKIIDRTNPNYKWDWWEMGGRWSQFFLLKTGEKVNSAKKSDIDFDAMRDNAAHEAEDRYDKAIKIMGDSLKTAVSWEKLANETFKGDTEKAREAYQTQEAVKLLRADQEFLFAQIDEFMCSKEEYVKIARDETDVVFAAVKDGQWYEKGKMGWWATVSNEKEQKKWNEEYHALLKQIPDDDTLTIVDCHI